MAEEQQDRGLCGLFKGKKHDEQQQQQQYGRAAAAAGYPAAHNPGHQAQAVRSVEGDLHSSGYGYVGRNRHGSDAGSYGTTTGVDHTAAPAGVGYSDNGVPHDSTIAGYGTGVGVGGHASHSPAGTGTGYDPTGVPHAAASATEAHQGTHGDGGAEEKKHGMLGKLQKGDISRSSSSGSSEDEAGEFTEKRRAKRRGMKEKIKKIIPGHKNLSNIEKNELEEERTKTAMLYSSSATST